MRTFLIVNAVLSIGLFSACGQGFKASDTASETQGTTGAGTAQPANSPPAIQSLSLGPDPLLGQQSAIASAVAIDYENDPITLVYDWSVNNVPVQSGQQTTLVSEYFSAGQVVSVSVTPSDAFGTGTSVTKSLTVQNLPPTAGSISLTPTTPIAGVDDLLCEAFDSTDPDGTVPTYRFSWTVDAVPFTTATDNSTSSVVAAVNTAMGQLWACTAIPTDGIADGPPSSASVTVQGAWMGKVTFTPCGQSGPSGPSQGQCDSNYSGTTLDGAVTVTAGIQYWTVPSSGSYFMEAAGAQGGGSGGFGANMSGEFLLSGGDVLKIIVGQQGGIASNQVGNGGGGGSFVSLSDDTPLLVAGGGGGTGHNQAFSGDPGLNGLIGESGASGLASNPGVGGSNGDGGAATNGNSSTANAAGGGGFFTDGGSSTYGAGGVNGGKAFVNGGQGGDSTGGFGGGGGSNLFIYGCGSSPHGGSGGGGYSGGGGGGANCNGGGGGGGSFNDGIDQINSPGINGGAGFVVIDQR